ncbi:MAG: hypothetical protein LUG99_18265 [Lachnospiraceae bacterium]|nr:hypothetical protein [Lachnospiraceae bacterium]
MYTNDCEKGDNFSNCLSDLKAADFAMADNNVIYRTGVIGQFNLSFELAWKALQAAEVIFRGRNFDDA